MLVSVSLYLSTSFKKSSKRLNWKSTVRTYDTGNVYQLRIEDIIVRRFGSKGLFTWKEGAPADRATRPAYRATLEGLTSHTFL